jgi:hypothetical protein
MSSDRSSPCRYCGGESISGQSTLTQQACEGGAMDPWTLWRASKSKDGKVERLKGGQKRRKSAQLHRVRSTSRRVEIFDVIEQGCAAWALRTRRQYSDASSCTFHVHPESPMWRCAYLYGEVVRDSQHAQCSQSKCEKPRAFDDRRPGRQCLTASGQTNVGVTISAALFSLLTSPLSSRPRSEDGQYKVSHLVPLVPNLMRRTAL